MDKVTKNKDLVRRLLQDIADTFRRSSTWNIMEIFDETRAQYLLFMDNWEGEQRDYGCFMHLLVKPDGKIWIHRDGTDLNIGQQLLDEGVPKSEIVLAFHPIGRRDLQGFAVE